LEDGRVKTDRPDTAPPDAQDPEEAQAVVEKESVEAGHGRRRVLGMGAAATPFVLTLMNRPALGNECTHSALLSGNGSTSARRDPNACFRQELGRLNGAASQQSSALSGQLANAQLAGDIAEVTRLQGAIAGVQSSNAASVSALRARYRSYPGFNG